MKSIYVCLSLVLAASSAVGLQHSSCAQRKTNPEGYYKAPSSIHGKTVLVPIGSTFEGRIDHTISSRSSHPGEQFYIVMASPVLANGVDIIIPTGSQVLGEVVEAIPHDHVQAPKGAPKPKGKLRVQITGLKTPDGQTYPLVGSITGEKYQQGKRMVNNTNLGGGYGYMGSAAGFEAVAPGMKDAYRRSMRGPQLVRRAEMMRDEMYGQGGRLNQMMGTPVIRSLVERDRELYIDAGAPLAVRVDAPFKIGFNPSGANGASMNMLDDDQDFTGERRFSRTKTPVAPPPAPVSNNPEDPLGLEQNSAPPAQGQQAVPQPAISQPGAEPAGGGSGGGGSNDF
jgi:hypothetical protein